MIEWEQPLNTHWVRMNTNEWLWTAPEHPLSAHEHHWVSVNTQWVCMTAIETSLNATHHGVTMKKIAFEWELNSPWMWLSARERLRVSIEHPLNTVSVHEWQWVSGNSPWTPIECAWTPLSECEHPMSVHDCHWVIIECDSLWCDHEKDCICVRIEQPLNAVECAWMPASEYWIPPECCWVHVNAFEWVLNTPWTHWVCVNGIEWVLSSPWTPIECTWMPLRKYFKGLNAHL